ESSQLLVLTSHHYDGVTSNLGQKEITRIVNLSQMSNALPRPGEYALLFKLVKPWVRVPTGRNRLSSFQRFDAQIGFYQVGQDFFVDHLFGLTPAMRRKPIRCSPEGKGLLS